MLLSALKSIISSGEPEVCKGRRGKEGAGDGGQTWGYRCPLVSSYESKDYFLKVLIVQVG